MTTIEPILETTSRSPKTPIPNGDHDHFAADITGETLITFRGSIEIEEPNDGFSVHARTIRAKIVHHVDSHLDYAEISVESPDRPRDTFDTPSHSNRPGGSTVATLSVLMDYIGEQERRIQEDMARQ